MTDAPYSRNARRGCNLVIVQRSLFAALCLLLAPILIPALRAQSNPAANMLGPFAPSTNSPQMRLAVVDSDSGQPIPGVKIRAWVGANLTTDDSGNCTFALPKPTVGDFNYRITMSKDGYVAKYITWSKSHEDRIEDIPTNYTAKMEKAATIGGILKTPDGKPVANARIIFSGLDTSGQFEREKTTLAPNFHTERTDADGKWQCNIVPQKFQDMLFRVDQPDFLPAVFGTEGSEEGGELVTRLPASNYLSGTAAMIIQHGIELSGIILDKTGKPVPEAVITRDHQWRNRGAVLQSGEDGRFKITNLRPGEMVLTIQADNLEPQTVAVVITNEMPEFKIDMGPGKILKGRVLDDAGQPVAGAMIQMDREDFQPLEFDWRALTDSDGRFSWNSAPDGPHPYLITADGFSLRSVSALSAGDENLVTLHKTSDKIMIDGQVSDLASHAAIGSFTLLARVATGTDITNWTQQVTNTSGSYSVAIDPHASSFTIEFRAPGCLPFSTDPKSPGDGDQQMNIQLEKGAGRLLAGKLMVPNYAGQINWKAGQSIVLTANVPDPDTPDFDSDEAKAIWMRQYMKTDEGKRWTRQHRSFAVTPEADGSFQCADIPSGSYQMRVRLQETADQGGGLLASLTTNFSVAAPPAGAELAMDLGTVAVPPPVVLKPGDTAPLFETKTVDGRSLKLADFKGRYVLLDFWATWCGPCVAEMPNLKAVYDKHAQDGRFAMISLSLDAQPAQPIDFAKKNGIKWTQGFLGDWDESPVPALYGVNGIPAIFLIGPDGKIVATELRGPEIEDAITQALGAF